MHRSKNEKLKKVDTNYYGKEEIKLSVLDKTRNLITKFKERNYFTKKDSEDRIIFKSGDTIYLLQLFEGDNDYYRILLPNFYNVKETEKTKVLKIINDANSKFRFVKTILINNTLWISIESYFSSEKDFLDKLEYFIQLSKITASEVLRTINGNN